MTAVKVAAGLPPLFRFSVHDPSGRCLGIFGGVGAGEALAKYAELYGYDPKSVKALGGNQFQLRQAGHAPKVFIVNLYG